MDWKGHERRRFPRIELTCKIHIVSAAATFDAVTRNIGLGGIRVFLPQEVKRGASVKLEIFTQEGRTLVCGGYIVWIHERKGHQEAAAQFDTGIQFDDMNEDDKKYVYQLIVQERARSGQYS